jgi:hypothetical protein
LRFAPHQSWFVVFRKGVAPASSRPTSRKPAGSRRYLDLSGPWNVKFDPKWGGPAEIEFPSLIDWTRHVDEGIRYYSGTATYGKKFHVRETPAGRDGWILDLGVVKNLAEVRLNGVNLGVVWTAPWQVDITEALRPGENTLEIDVVNLWPNRLIGDKYLPAAQKLTRTNVPLKDDARLLPSGLIGPVTVLTAER